MKYAKKVREDMFCLMAAELCYSNALQWQDVNNKDHERFCKDIKYYVYWHCNLYGLNHYKDQIEAEALSLLEARFIFL